MFLRFVYCILPPVNSDNSGVSFSVLDMQSSDRYHMHICLLIFIKRHHIGESKSVSRILICNGPVPALAADTIVYLGLLCASTNLVDGGQPDEQLLFDTGMPLGHAKVAMPKFTPASQASSAPSNRASSVSISSDAAVLL